MLKKKALVITRSPEDSLRLKDEIESYKTNKLQGSDLSIFILPLIDYSKVESQNTSTSNYKYDFGIFTSVRGVQFFNKHLKDSGGTASFERAVVTGVRTKETVLKYLDVNVCTIAEGGNSEAVIEYLESQKLTTNSKILYPCAVKTRGLIEDWFLENKLNLERLPVYSTLNIPPELSTLKAINNSEEVYLLFYSPSAFESWIQASSSNDICKSIMGKSKIITYGSTTKNYIGSSGFEVSSSGSAGDGEEFVDSILKKLS